MFTKMYRRAHRAYASEDVPGPLNSNTSEQVELFDFFHSLDYRDAEGTPLLAVPAGDAVLRPGAEGLIVGLDGLRDLGLHHRKVVKLVDHGDVDALGTGGAVAAVGTLAGVGMVGRARQGAGVPSALSFM